MEYKERITADPNIMLGKPCIKGTRITVEFMLRRLSEGMPMDEFLQEYPHLTHDDILAALAYSADVLACEETLEA